MPRFLMMEGASPLLGVKWLRPHLSVQGVAGSIPGWGAKIPRASSPKNQNINIRSNIVTSLIKALKMVHIKKILKNEDPQRMGLPF